jgi:hypothetical protein
MMASGSFLTIYRVDKKNKIPSKKLEVVKQEYIENFKKHRISLSNEDPSEKDLEDSIPLLVEEDFKSGTFYKRTNDMLKPRFSSEDGTAWYELMSFTFNSMFTALREHYDMSSCVMKRSDVIMSSADAKEILAAAKYILGKKYDRDFEDILANSFLEDLGSGVSYFISRHSGSQNECYQEYGCDTSSEEVALRTLVAAISAYFEADDFNDRYELKLVYSVW